MKICKIYEIEGRVQGVGFRPFVFGLARKYNLKGIVFNASSGVYAQVEGEEGEFVGFERELKNNTPPLARVDTINIAFAPLKNFSDFQITKSQNAASKSTLLSPDMSLCAECEKEMRDSKDRRFGYPLINCTNCGPRYSIVYTVPYDRANTSMRKFKMCEKCEAEYNDPRSRRYHAQPISCSECGPKIEFRDFSLFLSPKNDTKTDSHIGSSIQKMTDEVFKKLVHSINDGKIVAMKGMGGFHIICDALNERAVFALREKKHRATKPFAVLFRSIEMIKKYCLITPNEEKTLLSQARPIVLVKKREDCALGAIIAPNINTIGVFLPYTPLHIKLLDLADRPLIATSANISGEPIITTKEELGKKLGNVIEAYVDFDRDIVNFSDDSVLQMIDDKAIFLRLSRGLAPKSFKTAYKTDEKILAVGAHQKSTIAIFNGGNITISPYIGDLDSVASIEAYEKTIAAFKRFYDFEPTILVCDKHPNYASSLWAKKQNIVALEVQHHYAHILAVMFEQGLSEEVLGVAWDGTGLGDDKSIWGGEFFLCGLKSYKRVHTIAPFKLLGGDKSVLNIDRIAFSILYPLRNDAKVAAYMESFSKEERYLLEQSFERDINAPFCHSVGRLFDAAAAIILKLKNTTYDGESGLALEALYDESLEENYSIEINEKGEIEYAHWLIEALSDEPHVAATKFINSLALALVQIAKKYDKKVVLSGGVFQNKTLVKRAIKLLRAEHIEFALSCGISPNDSSIALGQLVYALNRL